MAGGQERVFGVENAVCPRRQITVNVADVPKIREKMQAELCFSAGLGELAAELRRSGAFSQQLKALTRSIQAGCDPLGDAFISERSAADRRKAGAVYTPREIVDSMVAWAKESGRPTRVIDPGAGSGRFLMTAGQAFPDAELVGIEIDPLAVEILKTNLNVCGFLDRATILCQDYRRAELPAIEGTTLFIANPPYVRHHDIEPEWKEWYANAAAKYGRRASKLAGLHIHFFLRTLQLAKEGDYGAFITSAEWLDVNYGSVLRALLANELGGSSLHVIDPGAMPFPDATTTGAITCFEVGRRPERLNVQAVSSLSELDSLREGRSVPWSEAEASSRWSTIVLPGPKPDKDHIELGELCRVHRGQVTGNNGVWIAGAHSWGLPAELLTPAVTKAREIIEARDCLNNPLRLRRIVDLPADLEEIDPEFLPAVRRFLDWAQRKGADQGYVARHRRAWWEVRLTAPAPIICTYMARRPPAFVRNLCGARHINVAHGLYPRQPLSEQSLVALTRYLRDNVSTSSGRTYAGGLTKFEPRELERVHIPALDLLHA